MLGKKIRAPSGNRTHHLGWLVIDFFFRQNNPNFTKNCNMPFSTSSLGCTLCFRVCLHGGRVPQLGEVTRLGGVTRHMLPHLPGVPYLHVNRLLNLIKSSFSTLLNITRHILTCALLPPIFTIL